MSLQLFLLNLGLRWTEKRYLQRETDPAAARARLDRLAERVFVMPREAHFQPDRLRAEGAEVPVLWASAGRPARQSVLLYLHGGAYLLGSPASHRRLAATLAGSAGIRAVLPDYRLAPEHPFPAAYDDTLTAYRALLEAGYAAGRIVLAGDSAGGGLALALIGRLRAEGLPRPACCLAFSPWTDLTLSGASLAENARSDVMLPVERITEIAGMYLGDADPADPRATPLNGDFTAAPPVLIQASRSEILRDDALRMAAVIQAAGGDVQLELWRDTPHAWPLFHGRLPEADAALASAARFLARHALPDSTTAEEPGAAA